MKDLSDEAHELELYIDNDSHMYARRKVFIADVKRRLGKGKYDPGKAVKLWEYYVLEGAKRYGQEILPYGMTREGRMKGQAEALRTFRPAIRRELAAHYARKYGSEAGHVEHSRHRRRSPSKRHGRVRRDMPDRRARVLRGALGAGRRVSNRAKSKLEVHEFMRSPPDELCAYYKDDARVGEAITNWMGETLGHVTKRGRETRPFGGKVVSIQMRGKNGVMYAGRCNLSSGTYCKLRRMRGKRAR